MENVLNSVLHGYWEAVKIGFVMVGVAVVLIAGLRAHMQNRAMSTNYKDDWGRR